MTKGREGNMSEEIAADSPNKIVVFGGKRIRRAWLDDQWLFSIVDIIAALRDSPNARDYWYRMKRREMESSGVELSTLCRQLKGGFQSSTICRQLKLPLETERPTRLGI